MTGKIIKPGFEPIRNSPLDEIKLAIVQMTQAMKVLDNQQRTNRQVIGNHEASIDTINKKVGELYDRVIKLEKANSELLLELKDKFEGNAKREDIGIASMELAAQTLNNLVDRINVISTTFGDFEPRLHSVEDWQESEENKLAAENRDL